MEADTAHRFWLGKVNVTVALARGQMKAKGPVAKILKLVPLVKPVFPRYKAQLEAGRAPRPAGVSYVEAGGRRGGVGARQMAGFKDFYQYVWRRPGWSPGGICSTVDRLRVRQGGRASASSWSPTRRSAAPGSWIASRPGWWTGASRSRECSTTCRRTPRRTTVEACAGGRGRGRSRLVPRGRGRLGDGHGQGRRRAVRPRRNGARLRGDLRAAAGRGRPRSRRCRWPRSPASPRPPGPAPRCRWPPS